VGRHLNIRSFLGEPRRGAGKTSVPSIKKEKTVIRTHREQGPLGGEGRRRGIARLFWSYKTGAETAAIGKNVIFDKRETEE